MNQLTFYEQAGLLVPSTIFLVVLIALVPGLKTYVNVANISVGDFGVLLIVAYAFGQIIAAAGNLLESIWWGLRGGMPSTWVIRKEQTLLSSAQRAALRDAVNNRFGYTLPDLTTLSAKEWKPVFAQIYRGTLLIAPKRIETFNGNYGLNRGLAASFAGLAIASAALHFPLWPTIIVFIVLTAICVFRMNRFGVSFAREVFLVFLVAPPASNAKPSIEHA